MWAPGTFAGLDEQLGDPELSRLLTERAGLSRLLAEDPRARVAQNFDRRDSLDRRIAARAEALTARHAAPDVRDQASRPRSQSRVTSDISRSPGRDTGNAKCLVCGRDIPRYRNGRKVRDDAETCGRAGCARTLSRRRRASS